MKLLDPPHPIVDVEEDFVRLRAEAARRGAGLAVVAGVGSGDPAARWDAIQGGLAEAEREAPVGARVPELGRFSGWRRRLARSVAGVLLYFARIVTNQQGRFNAAVVDTLRAVAGRLRDDDLARGEYEARLESLERTVAAQAAQLETLSRAVGEVRGENARTNRTTGEQRHDHVA